MMTEVAKLSCCKFCLVEYPSYLPSPSNCIVPQDRRNRIYREGGGPGGTRGSWGKVAKHPFWWRKRQNWAANSALSNMHHIYLPGPSKCIVLKGQRNLWGWGGQKVFFPSRILRLWWTEWEKLSQILSLSEYLHGPLWRLGKFFSILRNSW